jgi:hypothetical protein
MHKYQIGDQILISGVDPAIAAVVGLEIVELLPPTTAEPRYQCRTPPGKLPIQISVILSESQIATTAQGG